MARGYVAVTGTDISAAASGNTVRQVGGGLAAFAVADWVTITGFSEAANSGLFEVTSLPAIGGFGSALALDTSLTTEAAGNTVTVALATFFDKVRSALEVQLASMTGAPAIAYESHAYTPTIGTPWLRPTLLPAEPALGSCGTDGQSEALGLFVVDVYAPANAGPGYADRLAGGVVSMFVRGTRLSAADINLTIIKAWPTVARQEPDWRVQPVWVRWRCHTAAL